MRLVLGAVLAILVLGSGIFLFSVPKEVAIDSRGSATTTSLSSVPEALPSGTPSVAVSTPFSKGNDLPPQTKLANPPAVIKGIYLTGWSGGSATKMQSVISMMKSTELNAVVIDIKDYSGYVSYVIDIPEVRASGAMSEIRIARPNALIKLLHDNGIYVIGRITNFQDPILAKARPEWAMHNKTTGGVWTDNKGLAWLDPAAKPVWDYLAAITKDAFARGFDEVQMDYIRFASDGSIGNISYPYWDEKTSRAKVIESYFKFLRESFPNEKLSADLFGLATVNNDDLGIGQVIQSAYQYFDYVSPMVYPSHYAPGFLGYQGPAKYPYEVIKYSLEHGLAKLLAMGNMNTTASTTVATGTTVGSSIAVPYSPFNLGFIPVSKLRPWLQDFTINGVAYNAAMVRAEKRAVYDTLDTASSSAYYNGWLLWNASNNYTAGALDPE